jgi:hypothetical protein
VNFSSILSSVIESVIGGIGVFAIIYQFISNLILRKKIVAQQHNNALILEEIRKSNQKDLESYKTSLQNVAMYSEYQFKLYNELWTSLYELKSKGEDLWEHASPKNLTNFSKQLGETTKKVGQNRLVINDEHYESLSKILTTFKSYHIGKGSLINYRNLNSRSNTVGHEEIEFINSNEQMKNEYNDLVEILAFEFKKHLRQPMNNSELLA